MRNPSHLIKGAERISRGRVPAAAFIALLLLAGPAPSEPDTVDAPKFSFPVGEELTYTVYWGIIPVGRTMITTGWIEEDGRKLISIQFRTKSNSVIEKVYRVDDFLESVVDPETFLPVRFTKRLKEGRYRCDETTTFDHKKLRAKWRSEVKKRDKEYDIEPDTRDLISLMYYLRGHTFKLGDEKHFRVMADEKLFDLIVKVTKEQKVKVGKYGRVPTLRIDPKAKFEGIFVRKGQMILWVTQDPRTLLARIEAEIPFANIKAKLKEVRGPGDDFWIKKGPDGKDEDEEDEDES